MFLIYSFVFLIKFILKDDYKTQLHSAKKQLHEVSETQSKGDSKLTSVMQNLRSVQEEKTALETKLGKKTAALQAQVTLLISLYFYCDLF